jgi:flagellar hook-associated protein 3 FlgL
MLSRIGTFASAQSLLTSSLKVQAQMADQQAQEASGHKSTSFGGLKGDVGSLLNMQGQSDRLTADSAAATTAGAVVQAAYSAVGDINDLAATIRSQLAAALSGGASQASAGTTGENAANWLDTLASELNTEVGGVYVFSGQSADTAPVDFADSHYSPTTDPTVADQGYYQGSSSVRRLNTSTGASLGLSVPASSPGFEQLARALSSVVANPGDQATLQSAYDLIGHAVTDLASTQSSLSNQAATLDTLVSTNQDKITALGNLASLVDGADLSTAAVLVTQYQTQLEALYSSLGKIGSDSLLKYL